MKLDSNNHSVFNLHDHLVRVIKYHRKVIDRTISEKAKQMYVCGYGQEIPHHLARMESRSCSYMVQSTSQNSAFYIHSCLQKRSFSHHQKRISSCQKATVERVFWVEKFLSVNYRWCTHSCSKTIDRKSRKVR